VECQQADGHRATWVTDPCARKVQAETTRPGTRPGQGLRGWPCSLTTSSLSSSLRTDGATCWPRRSVPAWLGVPGPWLLSLSRRSAVAVPGSWSDNCARKPSRDPAHGQTLPDTHFGLRQNAVDQACRPHVQYLRFRVRRPALRGHHAGTRGPLLVRLAALSSSAWHRSVAAISRASPIATAAASWLPWPVRYSAWSSSPWARW